MEEEASPGPRQFTRPRPTGNLFFYRPQNEANTPLEQSQLASGPLSTPDSPSMVCSGASGIDEEEDDGWSCQRKEEDETVMQKKTLPAPEPQQQQQHQKKIKEKEHTFADDFPYPIPASSNNNSNNQGGKKKDKAALDLILKKAAVFLSPLPQEKEEPTVVAEEESGDFAEGHKDAVEESIVPPVPRCLAFDEVEESSPASLQENKQRPVAIHEPTLSTSSGTSNAFTRLKLKTLERQSSHVAALSKLKQLTVQKQRNRIAAMRPQSGATISGYTTTTSDTYNYTGSQSNTTHSTSIEEVNCRFKTPMAPPAAAAPRPVAATTTTTASRPRPSIEQTPVALPPAKSNEEAVTTGKKPYLKRRSTTVPMQHQGVADWSGVKPRTQSKLDSNLILRNKPSTSNRTNGSNSTSHGSAASVGRTQGGQQAPRRYIDDGGTGIESMEQYTAKYNQHNNNNNTSSRMNSMPPPPSTQSKRNPWGSNRPSTATPAPAPRPSTAAGPLGQGEPLSSAQRAAIRSAPFDPTSILVTPAVGHTRSAYGPLGAAALASNAGSSHNYYRTDHSRSNHEMGPMEDPLQPLVSQVDELLNSVGRAIRR
jgi:hypothetical protein